MKISYHWLCEHLPVKPEPTTLSDILTAIGLEVENLDHYEEIRGSLQGLVTGKVLEVTAHPQADKLKLTQVDIGEEAPLRIVCGAPNVAAGQHVVVAPVGTTLYPAEGDPLKIKAARIRGEQSLGMICAEDEIGLGSSHEGILILPEDTPVGLPAADYFHPYQDWIFEIGLTPNRMDAMSHLGVARDVCAWLSNHDGRRVAPEIPAVDQFQAGPEAPLSVQVDNPEACPRYAGLSLSGVQVGESPAWLTQKLRAIGIRPVNNVVDITNFVLHECGQPLHAFDRDKLRGDAIIVKNLPAGTPFVTLDGKARKLDADDLMICDREGGICLAGVFGGADSGVSNTTSRIFLESACFEATGIRRTSFRHDLRTEAALRFEKGVDISGVLYALKRAALLMVSLCGARIDSGIVDQYPDPKPRTRVHFSYDYLRKLSGKAYAPAQVDAILESLGFTLTHAEAETLEAEVPYSKPDISLPADLTEEIMRIDGYDQIQIPTHIRIAPSTTGKPDREAVREKVADYLVSNGFFEIFTNSITFSGYYADDPSLIHLLNNLSSELDVMRPSLLETGLEAVAHNLNHKQQNVLFFEFGKTYQLSADQYVEQPHLALYLSGQKQEENWRHRPAAVDPYFLKGHLQNLFSLMGLPHPEFTPGEAEKMQQSMAVTLEGVSIGTVGNVAAETLSRFGIKQPVYFCQLHWDLLLKKAAGATVRYQSIPRFPSVRRDLALILDRGITFASVEQAARQVKSKILQAVKLFDVFESEKLGKDKKSFALGFTFQHTEKTLTDKEIDRVMQQLIQAFEKDLGAEIRK